MEVNKEFLSEDLHFILDINHQGYCNNQDNIESTCDHEYNRCYRISGIKISDPTKGVLNYLAETIAPDSKSDPILKDQILSILESLHSQFNLTDTENYDWQAEHDYYGDHLCHVRFIGSIQEWLAAELEKINERN